MLVSVLYQDIYLRVHVYLLIYDYMIGEYINTSKPKVIKRPKKQSPPKGKSKTTINLDLKIKKIAQVYAIQNDKTLGEVIERSLEDMLI